MSFTNTKSVVNNVLAIIIRTSARDHANLRIVGDEVSYEVIRVNKGKETKRIPAEEPPRWCFCRCFASVLSVTHTYLTMRHPGENIGRRPNLSANDIQRDFACQSLCNQKIT